MGLSGFSHSSNGNDPLTWEATGQPRFFPGLVLPPALGLSQKVPGIGCPERELEARHGAGSIFLSSREGDQKAQPHPRPMRIREGKEGTGGPQGTFGLWENVQKLLASLTFMWYIIISLARWLRYWASFTFL